MRAPILTHLIPRHGIIVSSILTKDAPIAAAIVQPSMQGPLIDSTLVESEASSQSQLGFPFANGDQPHAQLVEKSAVADHLKALKGHVGKAREALKSCDVDAITYGYTSTLGALIAKVDAQTARPSRFFTQLIGGTELHVEAALGAAIGVTHEGLREVLSQLGYARRNLKVSRISATGDDLAAIDGDLARIKFMRAHVLMDYADHVDALEPAHDQGLAARVESLVCESGGEDLSLPGVTTNAGLVGGASLDARHEFYENAERKIRSGLRLLDMETDKDLAAVEYVGRLLLVEALARQADCAYLRGDTQQAIEAVYDRLQKAVTDLAHGYKALGDNGAGIAASYIADVATLFARVGSTDRAVEVGRIFFEKTTPLSAAPAVPRMLSAPEFAKLINARGDRLMSEAELEMRSTYGDRLASRTKAAIANAHSQGFLESLAIGAAGASVTLASSQIISHGEISSVATIAAMSAGAAIARAGMSVWNGWHAEQARAAGVTALYRRSTGEVVEDIKRLVFSTATNAALWSLPSAMGVFGPDVYDVVRKPLVKGFEMYFIDFPMWIAAKVAGLFDASTYQNISYDPHLQSFTDWFLFFARPYETATGLFYGAWCFLPSKRKQLEPFAKCFIPGALLLSADLCMIIAGKDDYFKRMGRGTIGIIEASFSLMTAGIVSLSLAGNYRDKAASIWPEFKKPNFHMNLVALAIVTGVSSALGGKMQSVHGNFDNPLLYFVQGGAITLGLLPLPLLVSGIVKRYIPFWQGMREGYSDSRDEDPLRRVYETMMGGVAAFRSPYAMNRVGRAAIPWYDWFSAGIRSLIKWDSNIGMLPMSAFNFMSANPWGTMTWPETGSTYWERDAFKRLIGTGDDSRRRDITAKLFDHTRKAGQRISPLHIFYPHDVRDRLWPLFALRRIWEPPTFPILPNPHYYASLVQLLMNRHDVALDDEQMEVLLRHISCLASHPRNYEIMRPLVKALYISRAYGEKGLEGGEDEGISGHGIRISRFFRHNPWIIDLLNIDRHTTTPPTFKYRRQLRAWVIGRFKMPREKYLKRVREHRVHRDRVVLEKQRRKEAKRLMKEAYSKQVRREKLIQYERGFSMESDEKLRSYELGYNKRNGNGTIDEKQRKKRILKLARTMAAEGVSDRAARKELEMNYVGELSELTEPELWARELLFMKKSDAAKLRSHMIERLARLHLSAEMEFDRMRKEGELLAALTREYVDKRGERPIEKLFE